ncbi:SIR2 family protein [Bradyrhizobium sp. HKCCYLRH3097]|uniref:P-loop NTPase n=1 Tax=Bradyrhizobium sp. HKCCYLRH3097 TaxID=3420752 RepID=UPI003EBEE530
MELAKELVEAVVEGRAVLFLGAGASRGARDEKGYEIPTGAGLANLIVTRFLGEEYAGSEFRIAYDLAASTRDVLTVQKYVFDVLSPFQPADFHLLIPTLPWAGILTTNYDLIIERAYAKTSRPLQKLVPHVKDDDGAVDRIDHKSLLYVKMHGCITRHYELKPPLIASTEQLITFREGRHGQFDTFMEWAKTKTLIFAGYSFMDSNLRLLFNEIIREGDNRPRHYIVNFGLKPAEEGYWRDRRVIAISGAFEDFLRSLNDAIPAGARAIGVLARSMLGDTSFTRFITVPGRDVSSALKAYLGSLADHVAREMPTEPDTPAKFYKGFGLGWYAIQQELDVGRSLCSEILRDKLIQNPVAERARIIVLKGHAGSGKSVALRRMAWDLADQHGKLCFFIRRQGLIDIEKFEEIFSLTNVPIYIFIDNAAEHKNKILELISLVSRLRASVQIVCAESFVLWNAVCEDLERYVGDEYEMRYLSEAEIEQLLQKLGLHDSLGYLAQLPLDKRKEELRFVHGRQLLVALLEATHGAPLVDILTEEYYSIPSKEARLLYLDICSLHRFGPPVRAGLISRIHDITFDQFRERMFKPLEQVIRLRQDARSGDYVYESRHSHIAHELYNSILKTQDERFENLTRIIGKLNPSYSYDLEVLAYLVRAEAVRSAINDVRKGVQVYELAVQSAGRRVVILHQWGVFQMGSASNQTELDRAETLLNEALEGEHYNKSIKHSLAELAWRRSRIATNPLEREAWRREAASRASALTSGESSPYPHHTLLKVAIDSVRDAMSVAENEGTEAAMIQLGDLINRAEDVLRAGLQRFPNDPALLGEEGELSNVLSQAQRAEAAFERAFQQNQKSTLLARRLARIKLSKEDYSSALTVLRSCLEANPSSRELHFEIARAMLASQPTADQTHGDEIAYHLRRAFSPGDKNYAAQFLYARQLCVSGRYDEAKPLFAVLAESRASYADKNGTREVLRDEQGQPKRLSGTITFVRPTFGFVQSEAPKMSVFVPLELDEVDRDFFEVGFPVTFELWFNMRGPVAANLKLLS